MCDVTCTNRSIKNILFLLNGLALPLLLAQSSLAQNASDPSGNASSVEPRQQALVASTSGSMMTDGDRLEQVLVIGEKLQRSYLETFSSVGIVTSEELDNYDIFDTQDAYKRLANVRAFADDAGSNSITIRGLNADGVTQPSNSAALISVVVDGVTQSAEGLKRGSRGLWDVEQLEVYRGPQSTIQGRNALAGTVVIKSKDPTFSPEFRLRGLYGELDRAEGALAVSGPLIKDQLALRLSGEYSEKTSDINFTDSRNRQLAEDEYYNARGKLLWVPPMSQSGRVLLSYNHVYDQPSSAPVSGPDFYNRQYAADSRFSELREMTADNYSADISVDIDERLVLRSITSYYDSDLKISSAPGNVTFRRNENRKDSDFTQEFRLEMDDEMRGLTGVIGLFYGDFEQDVNSLITISGEVFQDLVRSGGTRTWAAYADLRYSVTDSLSLIFGGRYQDDSVSNDIENRAGNANTDTSLDADFDEFLPKAGIAYQIDDGQTLGFTASKGYRQGFAETSAALGDAVRNIAPEYAWSYEIAYRLLMYSNRLLLGANIFYNDYQDQQVTVTDPAFVFAPFTVNAGDSTSYGMELEAQYDAGDGLSLYGALGLLDTELGDFASDSCIDGDCSGNSYSEAPHVTAALGGAYQHSSGVFFSIATSYTGEFYKNVANSSDLEVGDVFLVDAKLGYHYRNMHFSMYLNNAFNENYLTGISSETEATVGDARNVGVEYRLDF